MKLVIALLLIGLLGITTQDEDPVAAISQELSEIYDRHNLPGAVVIWVQGDSVLVQETFGLANLEEIREIRPDQTIFRVGSISKPFTAIGILQAVEKGLLDLDKDINLYFEEEIIKNGLFKPVTLHHLLTHTPGFDDFYIGKSARTREEAMSLKESIISLMPKRLIDPGEISSYSNFGVALAGFVLEHVDGRPFSSIMEEDIFIPLGMVSSSFDPGDVQLQNFMTGYHRHHSGIIPLRYDFIQDSPAGTMVTTIDDIVTFMKLILKPEGLESAGVLSSEMQRNMLSPQFTHHPDLNNSIGFLWSISEYHGQRAAIHDGGYLGTAARLFLFPDNQSAMFITTNMMEFGFISDVTELLTQTFLPEVEVKPDFVYQGSRYTGGRPVSDFAGTWRNTRYSKNSFTKFAVLLGIMGQEIKTSVESDTLLTMPMLSGELRRMVQVEPYLFQSIDDDYRIAFRESEGEITHLFTSGTNAFERIRILESQRVQLILLASNILFFALCSIFYPVFYLYRKIRKKSTSVSGIFKIEMVIALLFSMNILLMLYMFSSIPDYEILIGFGYGLPNSLYFISLIPFVAILFGFRLLYRLIREKEITVKRKAYSIFFLIVTVVYVSSLYYWKSIGWFF